MSGDVTLQEQFQFLAPFLVGEPRQFLAYQGRLHCIRANPADPRREDPSVNPCEGCPHFGAGCEVEGEFDVEATYKNKEDGSVSGLEPHARRGIGLEERPFLVLAWKTGHSHATLPQELWDNPHSDKAMYEANLHFVLTDPRRTTFMAIKGQLRFYGSREAFAASPYAAYLDVFDDYAPAHHPISKDYSAIEPRVNTLVTEEPEWQRVFRGTPKPISREIELTPLADGPMPRHVHTGPDGRTYCYLDGELDKSSFEQQCRKCRLSNACRTRVDHLKDVAGDWHGLNAEGLFGAAYTHATDSFTKKALRGTSKVVGLAVTYGGSAYTVARTMRTTEEAAQAAIDNFLAKLVVLNRYMAKIKADIRQHGRVRNRFGRRRDMSRWSHSQAPDHKQRFKDAGFAERTGLNYPIQGTAAELLKMGMIRVDELILREGWNPLYGRSMPPVMPVGNRSYAGLTFALLSSVHDELLNLIRDGEIERVIPQVHTAMQLSDIMTAIGAGFSLEMDCEYDDTRSWTASKAVPSGLIYLLKRLADEGGSRAPNAAIVALADCSPAFVAAVGGISLPTEAVRDFAVLVSDGPALYAPPGGPFTRVSIEQAARAAGVPFRLAIM